MNNNNQKCFWASNQDIIMICEGSCNTEDWSSDALLYRNSALHYRDKLYKMHCI